MATAELSEPAAVAGCDEPVYEIVDGQRVELPPMFDRVK